MEKPYDFRCMDFVKIEELKHLSSNGNGSTYGFESVSPSKGRLLAFRKAGSISGNHWHTGRSSAKDPEELVLISGSIKLVLKRPESLDFEEEYIIQGPCRILIYKNTFHRLEALNDICFLEFNSLKEHQEDTFYPKD